MLFARSDPETNGARGISCFVLDDSHVRVTREEEKLGLNSSTTSDLVLEDVHVDADRLLHDEGRGFRVAMATLDGGRIGIAAQALGIAQAAYDVARTYAQERVQFGRPIGDFQAIQWKLADMATEIDAARLLTYRAAWLKQQGRPHTAEGAKAKLFSSEMARRQTAEAIQILGGYGYTKEFPVERYYRDAKITEIYEGTSEIQRLVIARSILGRAGARSSRQPSGHPLVERVRLALFVTAAVRELDDVQAVPLVEAAGASVLLEDPQAESRRTPFLCAIDQLGADHRSAETPARCRGAAGSRRRRVSRVRRSPQSARRPQRPRPPRSAERDREGTVDRPRECAAPEATAWPGASQSGESRRARQRPPVAPV